MAARFRECLPGPGTVSSSLHHVDGERHVSQSTHRTPAAHLCRAGRILCCIMAAITDIRAAAPSIPLSRPTRIATRTVLAREFVLVWIEAGGLTGVGYTYAGT